MPVMGGGTVYDRMKRTGYLTGRNHRMSAALEDMQAPGEPGQGAGGPPNLRDAGPEPESCAVCGAYDGARCMKYGVTVMPNQLCDGFEQPEERAAAVPAEAAQ